MPLPAEYLVYPHRRHGFDNDRFTWTPDSQRAPLRLKSGAKAAVFIVIPLEFFPLDPPAEPFKHPGAMKTPYPDLRHYTTRDYGNRVGVYRLLKLLDACGIKATFAVNAVIAERYPPLIEAIVSRGHEIAAHGVSTAHIHHDGLPADDERRLINECRKVFPDATTWLSPARNESYRTPDLLTEEGFTTLLDWEADQRPLGFRTDNGPMTALPLMHELSDFKLMSDNRQQADAWADQIIEAVEYHIADHERAGAQCFGFTLTPYIAGQPFRIGAVKRVLQTLAGMNQVEVRPARDVTDLFEPAG